MNESVTDYLFHYNSNTKFWAAIPRDKYVFYWNDYSTPGVLRSKNFSTLLELVSKGDEFINKIRDESNTI